MSRRKVAEFMNSHSCILKREKERALSLSQRRQASDPEFSPCVHSLGVPQLDESRTFMRKII